MTRVLVVPGAFALREDLASDDDPVAELRAAVEAGVDWLLGPGSAVAVYAEPRSLPLARQWVLGRGGRLHPDGVPEAVLVIANGSATRTEKAPGHLDDRAAPFDVELGTALFSGDSAALAAIDEQLAAELWADVGAFRSLGTDLDLAGADISVDYDDAPYGVQYWVVRYTCVS